MRKIIIILLAIVTFATMMAFAGGERTKGDTEISSSTFKKTKRKCSKCSCSGYWGYYHTNGTYEGKCSNHDNYGYTCRHDAKAHGLRNW